jgi:putrescine transport system ATP-binding protein
MQQGRLRQIGAPSEVYESPNSRFVADFIGAVNLLAARVAGSDGALLLLDSAEAGGLLAVAHAPLALGAEVTVAVRPEKITLLVAPGAERNRLAGRVVASAYRGDSSTYEVELPTGKILHAMVPNIARHAPPFAVGQAIGLAFAPDAGIVLPA